ncbi:MAG: hypothetical protein KBB54_02325 [Candidatus Pacebacteria bacterium]|nr:hypothetical protein [Candidatus Paceibacterota bacterium]
MSLNINITPNTKTLYIILPGVSQSVHTGLLDAVQNRLRLASRTYLSVSFPFQDKGLDAPESADSSIEMQEVVNGIARVSEDFIFEKVVIIGKSYGAFIAAKLTGHIKDVFKCAIEFHVLGYIFDPVLEFSEDAYERVVVYQGELDRFGTGDAVKEKLPFATVHRIANADHSYRNERKEFEHEGKVLDLLFSEITL